MPDSSAAFPVPPRLLGRASSINVRKVLWTCDEAGVAVAREDWGAGFRPTSDPDFLALNPNALVPVLVVPGGLPQGGDLVLSESNTICRFLAARAGRTDLLPAEPAARAAVEQWMDWQATELNNAWRYVFMARVRHSPAHADPQAVAASVAEWNRLMGLLDARLARTGAFVAGEAFTLADVVLGLSAYRWRMTPMDRPVLPHVDAWMERLAQRPGYRAHGANGTP